MTHGPSRPTPRPIRLVGFVALLTVAALAGACTTAVTTPGPSATSRPTSASPSATPTASATPTTATGEPSPAPASAEACVVAPQTARLPSDRLVDVAIASGAAADLVTFVFGNPSLPGPPTAPEVTLEAAEPPFSHATSGLPLPVNGKRAALIRFVGMSITNDVGQPVYDGAAEFKPDLPALRHVVLMDMSEGVVGWYIGYDGPGCLTLASDGRSIRVAIDRPAP